MIYLESIEYLRTIQGSSKSQFYKQCQISSLHKSLLPNLPESSILKKTRLRKTLSGLIHTCDILGVNYCVNFSVHAIAKIMGT